MKKIIPTLTIYSIGSVDTWVFVDNTLRNDCRECYKHCFGTFKIAGIGILHKHAFTHTLIHLRALCVGCVTQIIFTKDNFINNIILYYHVVTKKTRIKWF